MSAKRIRVVALLDEIRAAGGGAERIAMGVAAGLDPERFESKLCVTRWGPEMLARAGTAEALDALEVAGVELIPIERSSPLDLRAWRPLREQLEAGTDVVHGHMHGSNIWAAWHGRRCGVPVVIAHEQTWEFSGRPLRRLIDRRFVAPRVDAYVAVSEDDREQLIDFEQIPAEKTRVIPNGIPESNPGTSSLRSDLGIPADAPLIGAVGRLHPQKSFPTLIEAAAAIVEAVPAARVVIVGDGPERGSLERRIRDAGLERTVLLTGARTDVTALLRELDIAVLPSQYEGSPLSLMEYMQAGRAIVASDVRGVTQLIVDGREGVLVAPGDARALAEAATGLLADPERAATLGQAARERQRAEFSIGAVTRRFESLYEELYAAKTSS